MNKLIQSFILVLFASCLSAQTPRFHYSPVQNGYLNNNPICGLWNPDLFKNCYAPAFHDWTGDGLQDLFFGLTNGRIAFYENTGTAEHPCFTLITDNFGGISVQYGYAAPFPCDLNNDGVIDFIVGNGISASLGGTLHYFMGTGSTDSPTFMLVTSMLADIDFTDATVPFAIDIDNDNDLDLYIGEGYGRIYFRENTGNGNEPEWDNPSQLIEDIGWRSAPQVINVMGDPKPELIGAEAYGTLKILIDTSTVIDTVQYQLLTGSLANIDACPNTGGCLVRPAFVDIDNDGDLDLFIRSGGAFYFYRNEPLSTEPNLILEDWNYTLFPDFEYALFFSDTNQDGQKEMYVPTKDGNVVMYENEGTPSEPNWMFQTNNFLNLATDYEKSLAFGDVNNDGLIDVIVGHNSNPEFNPKMMLFLNTGSGFEYEEVPFLENFAYGSTAIPELVDLDNDGFLELIVANGGTPILHFEATSMSGLDWQQVPVLDSPMPSTPGLYRKVTFGDLDNDGDLDMITYYRFYENIGSSTFPEFVKRSWQNTSIFGQYPTLVELTEDCGLELFADGMFYKYEGITPDIKNIFPNFCSNDEPVQLEALPQGPGGIWHGTNEFGVFNPNMPPGYHAVIYEYSSPIGCHTRSDTVWVNVSLAPEATIISINGNAIDGDTISVCTNAGAQTLLPLNPGGVFTDGGISSQGTFNPIFWTIGFHSVTYRISQNGCTDRDTLVIEITEPPIASIEGENTVCSGESINLKAFGGSYYSWNTGAASSEITVAPINTSTYVVTVTDEAGCTDEAGFTVFAYSSPLATIAGVSPICYGQTSTLNAFGGTSFFWSSGETTATITVGPEATTEYAVTVTNSNECTDTESFTVIVNDLPTAMISGNLEFCEGENTTLTASGGASYAWSTGENSPVINITDEGDYSVTITDGEGCTAIESVTVIVNGLPAAMISGNLEFCEGEGTILTASGGASYAWSTGENSPVINITEEGEYSVTVSDVSGCIGTQTVTVNVVQVPDPTIATINNIPIIGDTVFVCLDSGIQTLVPLVTGGDFSGISSDGQFDPALLGLGIHSAVYTLVVGNCSSTSMLAIVVKDCGPNSSTSEYEPKLQFKVRPNPFSESITFEFSLLEKGDVEIILSDLKGRQVKKLLQRTSQTAGKHEWSYDNLDMIPQGLYTVTLLVDGVPSALKVMKM